MNEWMKKSAGLLRSRCAVPMNYLRLLLKWGTVASLVGGVCGAVGAAFHYTLEWAGETRIAHRPLIWFLPAAGLLIVLLYRATGMRNNRGINTVMDAVRSGRSVRLVTAPLIFVATVLTHLFGGSAGREGAALQLGAGLGSRIGRLFRFRPGDMRIMLLCGMSGAFAALFGTPLTAVFFAIEFISVGMMYYAGIFSCILSSLSAVGVARLLGVSYTFYTLPEIPALEPLTVLRLVGFAVLAALVGILFCVTLHVAEQAAKKYLPNEYIRIFAGGAVIALLTLPFGTAYNGTSGALLASALGGEAPPAAFLLKLLFTVITVAAGFRGGEIIPTFCIGSTFGVAVSALFGLDPRFAAALGLIGVFSAATNTPVAAILLGYELFGGGGLICFAIVSIICFLFSGNYGLYSSQKFVFSKTLAGFDRHEAAWVFIDEASTDGRQERK